MSQKILFVGLDVDTQAFHGCAVSHTGEPLATFRCRPSGAAVEKTLGRFRSEGYEIRVCYEAGYLGYSLQRDLTSRGLNCEVVAPSLTPIEPGNRVKNDRLDSQKLAKYYRSGLLTSVYVPDVQEEADRDLVRSRSFLVNQLRSIRVHLSSFCRRAGLDYRAETNNPRGRSWTTIHWRWLESTANRADLPVSTRLNLNLLLDQIRMLEDKIAVYTAEIENLAQSDRYREGVRALCCFRGMKTLTAMSLVTEIGDIRRFAHPKKLVSYVGLDIREYSSAGKQRLFSITKMGNRRLRTNVVESCQTAHRPPRADQKLRARRKQANLANVAIADRCMSRLHKKASRLLAQGKNTNKVKVACARELLGFVWETLHATQKRFVA